MYATRANRLGLGLMLHTHLCTQNQKLEKLAHSSAAVSYTHLCSSETGKRSGNNYQHIISESMNNNIVVNKLPLAAGATDRITCYYG